MSVVTRKTLTIAIPTYNRLELLKICLSSILSQIVRHEDWLHILVINNASTDGTSEYLAELSHPCLEIVNNESNIGIAKNVNKITKMSSSHYVMWLTDDDQLTESALVFLKQFLTELSEEVGWIFSPLPTYHYSSGKLITEAKASENSFSIDPGINAVLDFASYSWAMSRQIFRRDLIDDYLFDHNLDNMYFIAAYATQMLFQHKCKYSNVAVVKHIYGNPVFWEEWGEKGGKRRAKKMLDLTAIIPKTIARYASNWQSFVVMFRWVYRRGSRWSDGKSAKKLYNMFLNIYYESREKQRVLLGLCVVISCIIHRIVSIFR